MLVMTRKPNERIFCGEDIQVTVVSIRGNQVRIGIDAPKTVEIFREEIKPEAKESPDKNAVSPNKD